MANKLVRRMLQVEDKEMWKRFTAAVLELLPKAASEHMWKHVGAYAESKGAAYVGSAVFRAKADHYFENNADRWLQEASNRAVGETAHRIVVDLLKKYDIQQYLKTLPGRFQALVDEELHRLAQETARAQTKK
jgi:hypothetical protein